MTTTLPLTDKAKRRHIRTGGQQCCPFCDIEMDMVNMDCSEFDPVEDGTIQQHCHCTKCKNSWLDVFVLKEIHAINWTPPVPLPPKPDKTKEYLLQAMKDIRQISEEYKIPMQDVIVKLESVYFSLGKSDDRQREEHTT